jgi:hypothetical protein
MVMERSERMLYHQIHPLKLAVDWTTAFISLWFFWRHEWLAGLIILFVPSIIISFILVSYADLTNLRGSAFGRYIGIYMTQLMQMIRFAGMFIMVLGAWYHSPLTIVAGLVVILLAWMRGLLWPAAAGT